MNISITERNHATRNNFRQAFVFINNDTVIRKQSKPLQHLCKVMKRIRLHVCIHVCLTQYHHYTHLSHKLRWRHWLIPVYDYDAIPTRLRDVCIIQACHTESWLRTAQSILSHPSFTLLRGRWFSNAKMATRRTNGSRPAGHKLLDNHINLHFCTLLIGPKSNYGHLLSIN